MNAMKQTEGYKRQNDEADKLFQKMERDEALEEKLHASKLARIDKIQQPLFLFFSVVFGLVATFCLAAGAKVWQFSSINTIFLIFMAILFACVAAYLKKKSGY
jgi:hypothetical protein